MPNPTGPGACEHGEWYVGAGNMVCGRGCERRASDIISDLQVQLTAARAEAAEAVAEARRAALEEAARECEEQHPASPTTTWYAATRACAAGIRALASTPAAAPAAPVNEAAERYTRDVREAAEDWLVAWDIIHNEPVKRNRRQSGALHSLASMIASLLAAARERGGKP